MQESMHVDIKQHRIEIEIAQMKIKVRLHKGKSKQMCLELLFKGPHSVNTS